MGILTLHFNDVEYFNTSIMVWILGVLQKLLLMQEYSGVRLLDFESCNLISSSQFEWPWGGNLVRWGIAEEGGSLGACPEKVHQPCYSPLLPFLFLCFLDCHEGSFPLLRPSLMICCLTWAQCNGVNHLRTETSEIMNPK